MRIISRKTIVNYYTKNPAAKSALEDWIEKVEIAEWKNFSDIKRTFNSMQDRAYTGRWPAV